MQHVVRVVLPVAMVLLATVVTHRLDGFYTTPQTLRAFYRHRSLLERAAKLLDDDEPNPQLRQLGMELGEAGFSTVWRKDTCFMFHYAVFMDSIDADHEIIYSPNGRRDLPICGQGNAYNGGLIEMRRIVDDWFYVVHE